MNLWNKYCEYRCLIDPFLERLHTSNVFTMCSHFAKRRQNQTQSQNRIWARYSALTLDILSISCLNSAVYCEYIFFLSPSFNIQVLSKLVFHFQLWTPAAKPIYLGYLVFTTPTRILGKKHRRDPTAMSFVFWLNVRAIYTYRCRQKNHNVILSLGNVFPLPEIVESKLEAVLRFEITPFIFSDFPLKVTNVFPRYLMCFLV